MFKASGFSSSSQDSNSDEDEYSNDSQCFIDHNEDLADLFLSPFENKPFDQDFKHSGNESPSLQESIPCLVDLGVEREAIEALEEVEYFCRELGTLEGIDRWAITLSPNIKRVVEDLVSPHATMRDVARSILPFTQIFKVHGFPSFDLLIDDNGGVALTFDELSKVYGVLKHYEDGYLNGEKTQDRAKHNMKIKYEMANPNVHIKDFGVDQPTNAELNLNDVVPADGNSHIVVPPQVNPSVAGKEDPKDTGETKNDSKDTAQASKHPHQITKKQEH
ncbi:hypothetical protein OROGR_010601 [Orobanche gracilis]